MTVSVVAITESRARKVVFLVELILRKMNPEGANLGARRKVRHDFVELGTSALGEVEVSDRSLHLFQIVPESSLHI